MSRAPRTDGDPVAIDPAWLGERLAAAGPALPLPRPTQLPQLARYAELLLDWNRRINLTGARSAEALVDEHLADALAILPQLPAAGRDQAFDLVDVGSGGGLPGVVLAVLCPEAHGVLLEPIHKKQAFLAHVLRVLELYPRFRSIPERLEEHLARGAAAAYDIAISRAVWPLPGWLERAPALLRRPGRILAHEGARGLLPPGAHRHPYEVAGRPRAIIVQDLP